MKDEILRLLRQRGDYVSGQEMSSLLQVSRTTVWKSVEALRREGYEISSATNRGYRLENPTRNLTGAEVEAFLGEHPWKAAVEVLQTVDSTNNRCKQLAAEGAPAGTVVAANEQTGGRGRLGRSFSSPAGAGVYLSVILRPEAAPGELLHLTCACAAAMCEAVELACGIRPGIKWTNDLVLGNKKLAGILTELAIEAESGRVQYAVLGIGINCSQKKEDFPPDVREKACSLEMVLGTPVNRNRLAAEMILALSRLNDTLLTGKADWMESYRRDCVTIGKEIAVLRGGGARKGIALSVDEDGGLAVRYENGEEETVSSGEVSVRGMYGYL